VISRFGVISDIIVSPHNDFHTRYPDLYQSPNISLGNVRVRHATGLMFKLPFFDKVEKFSGRLFTYTSDSEIVNTAEKKQYYITTYAQWNIVDPALFSLSFGSINRADPYLDNVIHPVVVQVVNRLMADDFVSNKDLLNTALANGLAEMNNSVRTSGIEIIDIQIHRTILPPANLESTYDRMTANRSKVAQQLRSEGDEAYNKSVSTADLEARKIEADALSEAGRIRGEADAEALEIYANAYGKDQSFYTYWRSLQALEKSMADGTTLVLDAKHPLWKDLLQWIAQE
ncbi:MAG: protease modulator HflC, partial [Clostridia bacterium]